MTDATKLTFTVHSTGKPLDLEIKLDSQTAFDRTIENESQSVEVEIDDEKEKTFPLEFILKNKTADHTVVDDEGNILEDSELIFSDIKVDEINIEELFWFQAEYSHNFNGSGEPTTENFYGSMGCNGTVKIDITTPIYLWLLENL